MSRPRRKTQKSTRYNTNTSDIINIPDSFEEEILTNQEPGNTLIGVSGKQEKIDGSGEPIETRSVSSKDYSEDEERRERKGSLDKRKHKEHHVTSDQTDNTGKAWEEKLNEILKVIKEQDKRVSKLERSRKKEELDESDESVDEEIINRLTEKLERKKAEKEAANLIPQEQLSISVEEIEAAEKLTKRTRQLGAVAIDWDSFTDPLAKVIEKRRLFVIKNWNTVWPQLQLLTDKPAISDRTWKRLAFGQYIDLAEFLDKELEQAIEDQEEPLKLTEGGSLKVSRDRKPKITYLAQWVQAWDRYSEAAIIICETRAGELNNHQRKVIKLCADINFEAVYKWDKAKRLALSEERSKTLLSVDYEIDAKYLGYGRGEKTRSQGTKPLRNQSRFDSRDLCRSFNWSWNCKYGSTCNFRHECAICAASHPARTCEARNNNRKRAREDEESDGNRQRKEGSEKRNQGKFL